MPTATKEKPATASDQPKGQELQPRHDKTEKHEEKAKQDKKPIVMGTAFTHPIAIQGETGIREAYGSRYATPEQACRGEHPTTNAPFYTGMAMLPKEHSPSRLGFEKLGPQDVCPPPKQNAAAAATHTTPAFRGGKSIRQMRLEASKRAHESKHEEKKHEEKKEKKD